MPRHARASGAWLFLESHPRAAVACRGAEGLCRDAVGGVGRRAMAPGHRAAELPPPEHLALDGALGLGLLHFLSFVVLLESLAQAEQQFRPALLEV